MPEKKVRRKPGPAPRLAGPVRFSLLIEDAAMLKLVEHSQASGRHVADLIREAVDEWVERAGSARKRRRS